MGIKDVREDEFGGMVGTAWFPYFGKEIEVRYDQEVPLEYVEKSILYLSSVDDRLMLEISKYALFFLQDLLENTSVGELLSEELLHIEHPLEVLKYMDFSFLTIDMPQDVNIPTLNLGGGCDWAESEGLQCLIRNDEVIYLGMWNDWSVWYDSYSDDYLGNYTLYEKRESLQSIEKEKEEIDEEISCRPQLQSPMILNIWIFVEQFLTAKENCSIKEAWALMEKTYLLQWMQEYPDLVKESKDFLYQCFSTEREKGAGELALLISENCDWNMF